MEERRLHLANEQKRNEQTIEMVHNSMQMQKQLMEMMMKFKDK